MSNSNLVLRARLTYLLAVGMALTGLLRAEAPRAAAGTYRLNRFEVTRTFPNAGQLPQSLAPPQETLPADQRAFVFGWEFKWPNSVTGPSYNRSAATITLTQVPPEVSPGVMVNLGETMSGEWNTTGYFADADHTIRLTGDGGTGEASFTDAPSGIFRHQFNVSVFTFTPQPDANGEIRAQIK